MQEIPGQASQERHWPT